MERRVIVIVGCTASGKGTLARALASELGAEIVSVDSMKVYRGMDIGTAKPSQAAREQIPHHLLDVADPWESFSAARYVELADAAVEQIHTRGQPVVAVGGTVLYLRCWYEGIFEGPAADPDFRTAFRRRVATEGLEKLHAELAAIDPAAAARIHKNDQRRIERAAEVYHLTGKPISELQQQWDAPGPRRPDWRWTLIGIQRDREENNRRINQRVRKMISQGLLDEARRIYDAPQGVGPQAGQAVGYAELFAHFAGELSLDEALERIKVNTRRLAKQQRTWIKRMAQVKWIDATGVEDTRSLVPQALALLNDA